MFGKTWRKNKGSRADLGVRRMLAILLSLSLLGVPLGSTGSASAAEVGNKYAVASASASAAPAAERLGGSDRYATAVKISQAGWPESADYAVLAAGADANLVDALTAAPLAYQLKAPILFTKGAELTPATETELKRLQVKTVYLVSGSGVILNAVRDRLQSLGLTVKSLGGTDRYATAVNIAKELENQGAAVNQVALTTGLSQADALSIAPVAAGKGMPILLTAPGQLPAVVQEYLAAKRATVNKSYVIGGIGAVSETAAAAMPGSVTRLGGTDRYDTNRQVVQNFLGSFQNRLAYLANGQDGSMADALAGAPLAAKNGAPVLLTSGSADPVTREFALKNLPSQVVALGGTGVVPDGVLSPLRAAQVLSEEGATLGANDPAQPVTFEDNLVLSGAKMTLANAAVTHSLTVQGDQTKLSQVKVLGTLYLDPGASGSVNLSQVEAGRIVVLSGAEHSIIFESVISQLLQVISSSRVHVVSQGATQISNTVVASQAILDAPSGNLGQVEVAQSLAVLAAPSVELRGVFTQAIVVSTEATVKAAGGASVAQLTVAPERSAQHISLQGTIQALHIDRQAEVALAANAQVGSTVVNAAAVLDATAGSFGQVTLSAKIGSPNSNPNGTPTPGTGAASLQVVELRGIFAQTIAVGGKVQVKAAQGANVAKLQVAPEQSGQRVVLEGEFASLEVNKEVKIELKDQAKVHEAVTNAKAEFKIPKGAEVAKLDPKGTGTTATGGGNVNGTATSEDTAAPPAVEANPPAAGGGSSGGGSSGGQTGQTQMITVSTIPNMNLTVRHTESLSVTTSPTEAAVSAFSSDTSVAAVSAGGHTLTVTAGTKAGTATITVTASKSGYITGTKTFNVEVFPDKPASFNLGAATGSLYLDLSGFQDQYGNKIDWDALTTTYGIDLQNSKVYLTTADNMTSTVYATLEQLLTRRVTTTTVDANAPEQIRAALGDGGTALHLTDSDLVAMGAGTGAVVAADSATKMFEGFDSARDTVVYASIIGTRDSEAWTIADNCALPDLSSVMNPAPDTTAPVLQTAEVNGITLTLTYDEFLDESAVPVAGDFAVVVNSAPATVSTVAVSGTTVILTLASAVSAGDVVTVSYTKGTNLLQDAAGNDAANLVGQTVSNSTGGSLAASAAPVATNITVVNNTGAADTVIVSGLAAGDTVTLYDAATAGTTLGSGTVTTGNTSVTINSLTLNITGGSIWVSVTSPGKAESTRTQKTYAAEATGLANTTVYVDASLASEDSTHFKTINAAVQAVADGGTIEVAAGTYPEMVKNYYTITNPDTTTQTVFKSFTLQGPNWAGQSGPLVHIQPPMSAIDPAQGYDYLLDAQAQDRSHPATVNVSNLWLDGSLGIAAGQTDSKFIEGIKLGYDVGGSITGNLITGTQSGFDALGGYAANNIDVSVDVTVSNNRFEQLTYDTGSVDSVLKLGAVNAIVSNNTMSGVTGAALDGIKKWYKGSTSITGNTFENFGPAGTTANAAYGGAMVSGEMSPPLGYALNVTEYADAAISLTITGNTFTNVQGILADDRASGNLTFADFAAANTISGSWLAYGDKTHIHWLSDTQDPDQLNYVLMDSALLNMATPTIWLTPGTYTMETEIVNPGATVILNSTTMPAPTTPDVFLTLKNTSVPVYVTPGSGVTCSATPAAVSQVVVANTDHNSIDFFTITANGDAAPVKSIQGLNTGFGRLTDVAVYNGEVFVVNHTNYSIDVFNLTDSGNVAPKRRIAGAATGLPNNYPTHIYIENGEIYVSNYTTDIKVFNATDGGDIAPKRTIPFSGAMVVAVNGNDLFVTGYSGAEVRVYDKNSGTLIRTLSGPQTGFSSELYGLALDNGEFYVSDYTNNAIKVFNLSASGDVAPSREIKGELTLLNHPRGMYAVNGELFVSDNSSNAVNVYRTGDNGNTAPQRVIAGPATTLTTPQSLTVAP